MTEQQLVHYTLTGAADWPMLATVGGALICIIQLIILGLIGAIYYSLPKQRDLQLMRDNVNLDIDRLADRFENILEKYMNKEQSIREKRDEDIVESFQKQRAECQARYDNQFNNIFSRLRG